MDSTYSRISPRFWVRRGVSRFMQNGTYLPRELLSPIDPLSNTCATMVCRGPLFLSLFSTPRFLSRSLCSMEGRSLRVEWALRTLRICSLYIQLAGKGTERAPLPRCFEILSSFEISGSNAGFKAEVTGYTRKSPFKLFLP